MSIKMTGGFRFVGDRFDLQYTREPVTLYDDTDGLAFGPTFKDTEEAEAFISWFENKYKPLSVLWIRTHPYSTWKAIADEWRTFLAEQAKA